MPEKQYTWVKEVREYLDKMFVPKDKNGMKNLDREVLINKITNIEDDARAEGMKSALLAVKNAKTGVLGKATSADITIILGMIVDTVARMNKIKL